MDCSQMLWVLVAAGCCAATLAPTGPAGITPGLHRRLDGAGFASPHEDDFFADYKDLVTPPKDLLDPPKDLLDSPKDLTATPEDLVETPQDLTDTPKDLLDEHQSDDFEEYAQGGGRETAESGDQSVRDDDTTLHDDLTEMAFAKHLKDSDKTHDHGEQDSSSKTLSPASEESNYELPSGDLKSPYDSAKAQSPHEHADSVEHNSGRSHFKQQGMRSHYGQSSSVRSPHDLSNVHLPYKSGGARSPFNHGSVRSPYDLAGVRSPYDHASVRSPYDQASLRSPYDQAGVRSPYEGAIPVRTHPKKKYRFKDSGHYQGHSEGLRGGYGTDAERVVRPEYAYRYGVNDPSTRDVKSAWEQRDGDDTRGGYAVVEPNGHTRVVEYSISKGGGFNAHVKHLPPGYHGR